MAPVLGDSPETPVWHVDAARGPSTPSFDHLVGAGEQRGRDGEANRLGGRRIIFSSVVNSIPCVGANCYETLRPATGQENFRSSF